MKTEQSVPKRRNVKFRRRKITQKKTYERPKDVAVNKILQTLCPEVVLFGTYN
jgi:hypothetical protein